MVVGCTVVASRREWRAGGEVEWLMNEVEGWIVLFLLALFAPHPVTSLHSYSFRPFPPSANPHGIRPIFDGPTAASPIPHTQVNHTCRRATGLA